MIRCISYLAHLRTRKGSATNSTWSQKMKFDTNKKQQRLCFQRCLSSVARLFRFFLLCLHTIFFFSLSLCRQKSLVSKVKSSAYGTKTRRFKFLTSAILAFIFTISFSGITLWSSSPALAAPLLTITPISWNVVGLDSNNVTVGPNVYMIGARVCNVGTTAATNVSATFRRDGATNAYLNLQGSDTLSVPSLPAGSQPRSQYSIQQTPTNCTDFYYNIVVTRDSAAYNTRQGYHIEATADGAGVVSTPTPRELYVEKLISQNRNAVFSFSGPTSVTVGQTYRYTITGKTATGGYEQLVFSPNFPNTLFQVLSASTTYSAPSGTVNSTIYADACGWENDPASTYYHNNLTCDNPAILGNYSGEKAGGNPITTTFTVKVLSAGTADVTNVIYDFSGSSYHYNSDYGSGVNRITISAQNPATGIDLEMNKSHSGSFTLNQESQYNLTVKNVGALGTNTTITVTDTLPSGLDYVSAVSATGTGWTCNYDTTNRKVTCTSTAILTIGQSSTIVLKVKPSTNGTLTNTATVKTLGDTNTANDTANDPTVINAVADVSVTKTDNLTTISQGGAIAYTIVVTNKSTFSKLTNIVVEDTVPSQITGVTWSCSASNGGNKCAASSGTGNNISTTVDLNSGATATFTVNGTVSNTATGTLSNTVEVSLPSGYTDAIPSDNAATDNNTQISAPDLTITKTHTGRFLLNQNDTFTLTVTNVGFASTTGTTTVSDTLLTGLTYVSATGTNWSCSASGQAVTCTNSSAIASNTSSTITLTVTRTSAQAITNTATVSNTSDKNSANDSATDSVSATARLRLVKRITRINTIDTAGFVDGPGDDDNASYWPTPSNTYLRGKIDGGLVKPGDEVEYTIYFLSDGGTDATNLIICDLVPRYITFVADTFATGKGIALASSSTSLPTAVTATFTNTADTDNGQFYAPATQPPAACKAPPSFTSPAATTDNVSGAVFVNVVTSPTTLPKATAAGSPSNSYGFIRFHAKVN